MKISSFAALFVGVVSGASIAQGQTNDVKQLVEQWYDANSDCRGSSSAKSDAGCRRRDVLHPKLEAQGYCYGRAGEAGYQMQWHVCTADSNRLASGNMPKEGPQLSLRQERAQALAKIAEAGFCIGYFDVNGDAAELYELRVAPSQRAGRHFLQHVQRYAATVRSSQAGAMIALGAAFSGYGPEFADQVAAATNSGIKQGVTEAVSPTIDGVRRKFEVCKGALNYSPEPPPPASATPPLASAPKLPPKQAPAAPNLAAVVTASEIEGVRQKIRPCWNTQQGVRDQAMIITLTVEMNQNAYPVRATVRDAARYQTDPAFRAAADAAQKAIMNPRCQPWPLSPEKFPAWKTLTFNFDSRDY